MTLHAWIWVWHDSLISRDIFILRHVTHMGIVIPEYVHECDMTQYGWVMSHLSMFMSVTWLILIESCHTWVCSWVWHDSLWMSHVTPEYLHECDMTHSYWVMSHLSMFMCVTWLIHIYECNMTHYGWVMSHLNSWVWHDSFILSHVTPEYVYECDITHYEWVMPYLNNFMSVTW